MITEHGITMLPLFHDPKEKGNYLYVIDDLEEVDTGYKYPRIFTPKSQNSQNKNEENEDDTFDWRGWMQRALMQNPAIKVFTH